MKAGALEVRGGREMSFVVAVGFVQVGWFWARLMLPSSSSSSSSRVEMRDRRIEYAVGGRSGARWGRDDRLAQRDFTKYVRVLRLHKAVFPLIRLCCGSKTGQIAERGKAIYTS